MPVNGMTLGNDCKLVIMDSVQGLLTFPNITMVNFAQIVQSVKSVTLNGIVLYADLPEGWSASLKIDAGSSALMNYFAQSNQTYLASGTLGAVTLQQTVLWGPGDLTSYHYKNGAITLSDAGNFAGNEKTSQGVSMKFSSILRTA